MKLDISTESDVTYAALDTKNFAKKMGFTEKDQYMISTAVSELARNILIYAQTGNIYVNNIEMDYKKGIQIIAEDFGPGIENIEKCMEDNYSTRGTLGVGLPGAKRLMDEFHINSNVSGTKVTLKKWI